jgi:hypothetical protein
MTSQAAWPIFAMRAPSQSGDATSRAPAQPDRPARRGDFAESMESGRSFEADTPASEAGAERKTPPSARRQAPPMREPGERVEAGAAPGAPLGPVESAPARAAVAADAEDDGADIAPTAPTPRTDVAMEPVLEAAPLAEKPSLGPVADAPRSIARAKDLESVGAASPSPAPDPLGARGATLLEPESRARPAQVASPTGGEHRAIGKGGEAEAHADPAAQAARAAGLSRSVESGDTAAALEAPSAQAAPDRPDALQRTSSPKSARTAGEPAGEDARRVGEGTRDPTLTSPALERDMDAKRGKARETGPSVAGQSTRADGSMRVAHASEGTDRGPIGQSAPREAVREPAPAPAPADNEVLVAEGADPQPRPAADPAGAELDPEAALRARRSDQESVSMTRDDRSVSTPAPRPGPDRPTPGAAMASAEKPVAPSAVAPDPIREGAASADRSTPTAQDPGGARRMAEGASQTGLTAAPTPAEPPETPRMRARRAEDAQAAAPRTAAIRPAAASAAKPTSYGSPEMIDAAAPRAAEVDPRVIGGDADDPRAPFGAGSESASRSAAPSAAPPPPGGFERHGEAAARAVGQAIIAGADRNRVELRLDPPELGRVAIDLRIDDGAVAASVSAERPETLDLLRRHADALQRELASAGFDRATLAFSDRGDGRQGSGRGFDGAHAALGEPEPAASAAPPRASAIARGPLDRLDIRL